MSKLNEAVNDALEAARANPCAETTAAVKAARAALSDAICAGAKPCPSCGSEALHGMAQPGPRGRTEYEVGCRNCGRRVRGGLLPRHTVEAWNES